MNPVIEVNQLGKKYRLGEVGTGTISHDLNRWWAAVRGKEDPYAKIGVENDRTTKPIANEYVWALQDINFTVLQGEVLGIIGRNGAGKSTLLKLLSRITAPSIGTIKIKGRIGSLLEVGTGFHPEMTGRENVYLNGTILGMRRFEIDRKFDEIIDFAGVEKYIDTPVKRYSSGMMVRLAFAVAAFLDPEILIVDEVLAVGDAAFQSKCLGKMKDVSTNEGRTILFVSHNMAAIQNLCTRAILLSKGTIEGMGNVPQLTIQYLQASKQKTDLSLFERNDRSGSGIIRFTKVVLEDGNAQKVDSFVTGQNISFTLFCTKRVPDRLRNFMVALGVDDGYGNRVTNLNNEVTQEIFADLDQTESKVCISIDRLPLMPGQYFVTIYSSINGEVADWIQNAFSFTVNAGDYFGTGKLIPSGQGQIVISHHFQLHPAS